LICYLKTSEIVIHRDVICKPITTSWLLIDEYLTFFYQAESSKRFPQFTGCKLEIEPGMLLKQSLKLTAQSEAQPCAFSPTRGNSGVENEALATR